MAQIIKLKRSLLPNSKPTTSDLSVGELAINVYDGKVFLRKSGSADTVQEIITNDYSGSINMTGAITASYFVGDGSGLTGVITDIGETQSLKRSFTNQSTWIVNHNFDTENAIVQVFDNDGYALIPQTLRHTDNDTVTITFPTQESGYVVVAKGGHLVSGTVDASQIDGLDTLVGDEVRALGLFSSSNQVNLSGDVTGTGDATVISQIDGGSI